MISEDGIRCYDCGKLTKPRKTDEELFCQCKDRTGARIMMLESNDRCLDCGKYIKDPYL